MTVNYIKKLIVIKTNYIDLQIDLAALESWDLKWGMQFNVKKCIIMQVNHTCNPHQYFYSLDREM